MDKELIDFILQAPSFGNRRWFRRSNYKLYLRNTPRDIEGKLLSAITIAVIEVNQDVQRRGIGSNLVQTIHKLHKNDVTVIECCHHEGFYSYLVANGWCPLQNSPQSLYLLKVESTQEEL